MYSESSLGTWDVSETLEAQDLHVAHGDTGPRRRLVFDSFGSPYTMERLAQLPAACSVAVQWTPTRLFDVFAASMGDYYPFFEQRGIDWAARTKRARETVHDGMAEIDLFRAMRSTLEALGDGHVGLNAEINGESLQVATQEGVLSRRIAAQFVSDPDGDRKARQEYRSVIYSIRNNIQTRVLNGTVHKAPGDFTWGRVQDEIGYIVIGGMGIDENMALEQQLEIIHAGFDEMLTALDGVRAIVLDCSLNGGGMDEASLAIASHFIDEVRQPYSKGPGMYPEIRHEITLTPWGGRRFTGPVYLISSDFTASAAEIFQLCLKDEPHVTLVGTRGASIFSDVVPKELPNGWMLNMSIETYRDAAGVCFEGVGIPVDVEVPIFAGPNLHTTHVEAIERILDIIWSSE